MKSQNKIIDLKGSVNSIPRSIDNTNQKKKRSYIATITSSYKYKLISFPNMFGVLREVA